MGQCLHVLPDAWSPRFPSTSTEEEGTLFCEAMTFVRETKSRMADAILRPLAGAPCFFFLWAHYALQKGAVAEAVRRCHRAKACDGRILKSIHSSDCELQALCICFWGRWRAACKGDVFYACSVLSKEEDEEKKASLLPITPGAKNEAWKRAC